MDGWKSRTCPLEASRVKACQANVRRKLCKQKNESQGAVGREWMVVGTGGLQGKFIQSSAYEDPAGEQSEARGRA